MERRRVIPTLLFLALSLTQFVTAQDESFGSWSVGFVSDRTSLYAATINDSGALLGEYCTPSKGSCMWVLGMSTGCEEGSKYPVLANANTGAVELEIVCNGKILQDKWSYAFTNFEQIDALVKGGSRVGFAMPLQQDQFRVVRFLLNGASVAIARMRSTAERLNVQKVRDRTNTRDQDI